MYGVTVRQHFDAAHYLRDYHGRCENLHGHRYEVTVTVASRDLDSTGLAFDFTRLKAVLKERFLARYDHVCLNDVAPFTEINPSAENIARTIYQALHEALPQVQLAYVQAYESPDAWATYREG